MHSTRTLLTFAMMASSALAAPTPAKPLTKRTFHAPVSGRAKLCPLDEINRARTKHGWEVIAINPEEMSALHDSAFGAGTGSSPTADYGWTFPQPGDGHEVAPAPGSGSGYGSGSQLESGYGSESGLGSGSQSQQSAAPLESFTMFEDAGDEGSAGFGAPITTTLTAIPMPTDASSFESLLPSAPVQSIEAPVSSAYPSAPAQSSKAPGAPYNKPNSTSPVNETPSQSTGSPSNDDDNGDAEVTATPEENESQYLSQVTIGGQVLNLNFDTGSADLWVFSTELPDNMQDGGHTLYDPSKSSTFEEYDGASWQIRYGDGSTAQGNVGFDEVTIGDIIAKRQAVELASSVSASFLESENGDGLVGLGFGSINQIQPRAQKTFFETVLDQLDAPVFTADLDIDASGTYEFGKIDDAKCKGEILYTDIDSSQGFWQFESPTYTIGGKTRQCTTCSPAIADTGTSLLLVDQDVADDYYDGIDGSSYDSMNGGYTFPCDTQLPAFGVAIGPEHTAVLDGKELVYANVGRGECFGSVQGTGETGGGVQIFGAALLKRHFAVFDHGGKRFGFAEKA